MPAVVMLHKQDQRIQVITLPIGQITIRSPQQTIQRLARKFVFGVVPDRCKGNARTNLK